jgi:hypothetical protein
MSNLIKSIDSISLGNLNLLEPEVDKNEITCYLSYGTESEPILFQLEDLNVISYKNNNITLNLKDKNNIRNFFNEIDESIVKLLKDTGVLKIFNIKGITYKSLLNEVEDKIAPYDVLRVKILDDGTNLFDQQKNTIQLINLEKIFTKGSSVKSILRLDSVIINKELKTISPTLILLQGRVKKNKLPKPIKIVLQEYSIIDTEDEKKSEKIESHKINLENYLIPEKNNIDDEDSESIYEDSDDETSESEELSIKPDSSSEEKPKGKQFKKPTKGKK